MRSMLEGAEVVASRRLRGLGAVALSGIMAACSSPTLTPTPAPTPSAGPTPTVAATGTANPRIHRYGDLVVGFIHSGFTDARHLENVTSFNETAAAVGVKLVPVDAGGRFADQVTAFHRFNSDPSVNVIVLDPVQGGGYGDVLTEARASGKVVVIEYRHIDADPSLYAGYVGSDFGLEGQKVAAAICELLAKSQKKHVIELAGAADDYATADRSAGFRTAMSSCGIDLATLDGTTSALSAAGTEAALTARLTRTSDVQGIFAHSDEQAIGAIGAMKDLGFKPGTDVQVVSIGVSCDAFKYLISAELGADIESNPLLAPQVFDLALRTMNGETSLPKWLPAQEGSFYAAQGRDALSCYACPGVQAQPSCPPHSVY